MPRPALLLLALGLFLAFVPHARASAATVYLSDSKDAIYLYPGNALEVLEDPNRSLTIESVASHGAFEPMHPLTHARSAYWLRFSYSTANTTKSWLLFAGFKPETVDLYVPDGRGSFSTSRTGNAVPFVDRPLKYYGALLLELPPAPAPRTSYLRITTREPEVTIAIDSRGTMDRVSQTTFAIIIGLDSIILSLILSCIVYYLTSRDKTYLLYMSYLIAELLYRSNDQGIAPAWLWPHSTLSSLTLGALLDGIRIVAATVFLRAFLNLPACSKLLDRINLAFAAIFFLLAFVCFIGLPLHASFLSELSLIYVPLWLLSALVAWRKGEEQALLIAVGWSLLMLFSVSFGLKQLGFARGNIIIELIISQGRNFGVGLQTLFLSLAISTDLRRLMRSRQYYASLAANDALTGLANRRTFEDALTRELSRAIRSSTPLSLLVYDVDFFKSYNDTRGHSDGDALLRMVSERASAVLRTGDLLCRYGGDEFVAILPGADEETALRIGERIRSAVAEREIRSPGSRFGIVTLSIGIATTSHLTAATTSDLFEAADRALFVAKELGRNTCVSGSMLTTPS